MIGRTLSHYRVLGTLGEGGMGIVYHAVDTRLDRPVAIKLLKQGAVSDPDRRERFVREARAASALNHPNIITIYEIDVADEVTFIAMESVDGEPLARLIPAGGLAVDRALDYAVQIAGALAAAHASGIVHRDIKPGNIMVTRAGRVKVLDFGLAKLTERLAFDSASPTTTGGVPLTRAGVAYGTPAYMSPEQVHGRAVDARSDVFSVGIVLYEMLAGRRAFHRDSGISTVAAILHEQPDPLRRVRRDLPRTVERILTRCLEKDPEKRYASARALLEDLAVCQARLAARRVALRTALRRPSVAIAAALVLVALVTAGTWWIVRSSQVQWARMVALPEATRLVDQGRTYAAFRLLRQAEALVPDDPILKQLLVESTTPVTVRTTPAGARVYVRDFFDAPDAWQLLGSAPLDGLRLPTGTLVFKISREGFETSELLAFTPARTLGFSLQPADTAPPNMVHVPGGRYELFSTPAVELDDYLIDKYEVTKRQFKEFVHRGGYEKREYWTEPFVKEGKAVSWEEARQVFRDRTGRPGPATWELGTYPDGEDDYPVGGVNWYEAAAYCASVGKQLPTVYHWYQAADLGSVTGFAQFGNFQADGPAKVGHPLRLGGNGTYDMAGNVKEWSWNQADPDRRYILGGGWNEPSYTFSAPDAQRPFNREPTYGFRCAKYREPLPASLMDRVEAPSRDYRAEAPVGDEAFAVYESLYGYDRTPLDAGVESVDDSFPHWRMERVSFAAAYGNERVPATLFLPKNALPPYQTVVYFPGSAPWFQHSSPRELGGEAHWFLFLVRSGRAVLVPVYKGMYERHVGSILLPHIWRDVIIHEAKDLRRAVDYLETRSDIDAQNLAYFGLSTGAGLGPIMTAVEPRFRASILLGGGLHPGRRPPESEAFNFLPRVTLPTLMLNGRHDFLFPSETSQAPMFHLLGTWPADKRHRTFESGHVPTERQEVMKEALDWLDRYLGPVTKR